MLLVVLEALMISSALSCDAFVASFAYGSNKIKIPLVSVLIINFVCSFILGISLVAGTLIRPYIPNNITVAVSFCILFILGLVKILDSFTKSIIRRHSNINREIKFSMFNFKFILNLYADPIEADVDASKFISPAEAASLAVSLSLDGLAVGFGAAIGNVNVLAVILCSLVTDVLAVMLGCHMGNKVAHKMPFNLSWLGGALLMVLAGMKLF